jgi:hypothetical protein
MTSLERIYADDYLLVRPNGDSFGKGKILGDLRRHFMRFTSFQVNDVLIRTKGQPVAQNPTPFTFIDCSHVWQALYLSNKICEQGRGIVPSLRESQRQTHIQIDHGMTTLSGDRQRAVPRTEMVGGQHRNDKVTTGRASRVDTDQRPTTVEKHSSSKTALPRKRMGVAREEKQRLS